MSSVESPQSRDSSQHQHGNVIYRLPLGWKGGNRNGWQFFLVLNADGGTNTSKNFFNLSPRVVLVDGATPIDENQPDNEKAKPNQRDK
jgi:hypothetical protein